MQSFIISALGGGNIIVIFIIIILREEIIVVTWVSVTFCIMSLKYTVQQYI